MMGTGQQAWDVLAGLPAWQVTEIPRPSAGQDGLEGAGDNGVLERVLALTSAYGCDTSVAVAWLRDRAGGPVRVLAAGPGLAGGEDGGQTVLTIPPGARAVPLPDGGIADTLAVLPCWARIGGVSDVLLAQDSSGGPEAVPSLETGLLTAWLDAFAWLVVAEPVAEKEINDLAFEAAHAQLTAEGSGSPRSKLAARRAAARHEELRQAVTAGLWRVHLLTAGTSPASAARVARLVCASAGLHGLPYALSVRETSRSLRDTLAMADGPRPARHRAPQPAAPPVPGDRSWWDTPMNQQQPRSQWPSAGHADDPALAARLADDERDTPVPQSPFTASTRLLAALARPPSREVPGLLFTLRPDFDVTPEHTIRSVGVDGPGVAAGAVLDGNRVPAGTLTVPMASLNRHVFVCGATGSGKSQTIRALLEQAAHVGLPWLVIEPAKAEYRLMAARLPGAAVIRIRPGDLDQPPAGINPLEPAAGPDGTRFALQTHADLLRALFLAAFQADEPFPQVLAAALTRCYEQAGWDLVTGQPAADGVQPAYPGLEDLQSAAMAVVNEIGYGREVRDNVRGFVTVRIGSLRLGTTGRFLDGGHPIDFGALLNSHVVFEIEDAGDDRDKAFLMGAVLLRLTEHLRIHHRPGQPAGLRHLTVVEEAHRLLRQPPPGTGNGPAAQAVEMFADLLAEIRAYGEGLVIAEQIPAKLVPDVIKNTAVKICHRLPALDDRQAVGATMNLTSDQSQYLVTLVAGEAAVHVDGMDFPLLVRMPDGTARETAPAQTAALGPVIGRRSPACGPDCIAQACTLGQMRAAQRQAITDPRLTLWAELTVLAHLTGRPMPTPAPAFAAALQSIDLRLRDCALAHAADAAVATRIAVISSRISPQALSMHAATSMRQAITGTAGGCTGDEPEYLAPPFRWAPVRAALQSAPPAVGRHPRSDEWEHLYGTPVPGKDAAGQLHTIEGWYLRDQNNARAVTGVIWGTLPRPAIEQATGARATGNDWTAQLTAALEAFAPLTWPVSLIKRPGRPAPGPMQARSE
jgi:uncharacterized protein